MRDEYERIKELAREVGIVSDGYTPEECLAAYHSVLNQIVKGLASYVTQQEEEEVIVKFIDSEDTLPKFGLN